MTSEIYFDFTIPLNLVFEGEPNYPEHHISVEAKTKQSRRDVQQILDGDDPQVDYIEIVQISFPAGCSYASDDLTDDALYTIKEHGCTEAKRHCVEFAFNISFL